MVSIYVKNGYESREDYLATLAEDFGIEVEVVVSIADLLGPIEGFDGLVSACEDLVRGAA